MGAASVSELARSLPMTLSAAALYLNPNPRRILVIGLGGGAVPGAPQTLEARLRPLGASRDALLPMFSRNLTWPAGTRVLSDQHSPPPIC